MAHVDTSPKTPVSPEEVPMPVDPTQEPSGPESPHPEDPEPEPAPAEVPQPSDDSEDTMYDPFDDGNFPV